MRLEPQSEVYCRSYYPSFYDLNNQQQAFFLYWRQEYEAKHVLPTHLTYCFLYAYELAAESPTPNDLNTAWLALGDAIASETLRHHLVNWMLDLYIQQRTAPSPALLERVNNYRRAFDVAIAAGIPPSIKTLLPLSTFYRELPPRTRAQLKTIRKLNALDTSALIDLSATIAPTAGESFLLFESMGNAGMCLQRFGPMVTQLPTILKSPTIRAAIDTLSLVALRLVGHMPKGSTSEQSAVEMVSSKPDLAAKLIPIERHAIAQMPTCETLDGLLWTIRSLMPGAAQLVLLAILWTSDRKPYIEGAISFTGSFRAYCTIVADAIHDHRNQRLTIGLMRSAFFSLGTGPHPILTLEPTPHTSSDIRTNITVARFIKPLQHLLIGSDARTQVLHALLGALKASPGSLAYNKLVLATHPADTATIGTPQLL